MPESGLDVRTFTVGDFRENCYIVRRQGGEQALLVDPGDEAERLIEAVDAVGAKIVATLITHTHIDHVGAVAALARHTGAPVYCPALEREILADIDGWMGPLGFTGYESYEADEVLSGGEHLELAGLSIDVLFTPGHSVGHLTFSLPEQETLLVGDVLFRGSVGRVDIPGGDWPTLMASISRLLAEHPDQTHVLPGHGARTTLGDERATNPFLTELAAR
ncbi:MAG TPA: MBL fold metallo-hydrolase [Solirubrobacteraceae bacterium]|jgi:glyoxylase-like metal-dependent hydrolase (beta-lactamase superfamily II)